MNFSHIPKFEILGCDMARVARPRGGSWRLMGNQWWKQGPVVEAAGGWVGELRGAVAELGDGSAGPESDGES